jgi:hypothetical protein
MGVKSTVSVTRKVAVQRAADLWEKRSRRAVEARFHDMSNKELEAYLEQMNDDAKGGEGFENYDITD